jgi:replicative DNA helicase
MKTQNKQYGVGMFEGALREGEEFTPIAKPLLLVYEHIALLQKKEKKPDGIPTGFKNVDDILSGLHNSDLIVIGARPSCGKTALMLNIARNASRNGYKVGMFSLDMDKSQVVARIMAADAGISLWSILTGRLSVKQNAQLKRLQKEITKMKFFIDDTPRLTVSEVRLRAIQLQEDHGLDLLIVDSAQLIEHSSVLGADPVKHMTEIARGLKLIAKELEIPVVATVPFMRNSREENHWPQRSDLCEFERSADVVFLIGSMDWDTITHHGMREGMRVTVGIEKNHGRLAHIELWFDIESASFEEA